MGLGGHALLFEGLHQLLYVIDSLKLVGAVWRAQHQFITIIIIAKPSLNPMENSDGFSCWDGSSISNIVLI